MNKRNLLDSEVKALAYLISGKSQQFHCQILRFGIFSIGRVLGVTRKRPPEWDECAYKTGLEKLRYIYIYNLPGPPKEIYVRGRALA